MHTSCQKSLKPYTTSISQQFLKQAQIARFKICAYTEEGEVAIPRG